MFEATLFGRI